MSGYKLKRLTNAYFNLLHNQGIPEKFVKDYFYDGDWITVILLTGIAYSEQI